jgi:hypothetical protein
MNTLYHKAVVASVCTALGFFLGVNPEAKAASFTFAPFATTTVLDASIFKRMVEDDLDGNSDQLIGEVIVPGFYLALKGTEGEAGSFAVFNIGSFSPAPNTVISSAVLQAVISSTRYAGYGVKATKIGNLGIFAYAINSSKLEEGIFLSSIDVSPLSPGDSLKFDVTPYINQKFSNGEPFAGFGFRFLDLGGVGLENNTIDGVQPRLIIETADVAEPVPEPTTIFGSVIALGVGGWLKRKKSNRQNKTVPQR